MLDFGSSIFLAVGKTTGIKSSGQNLLEFFGIILIFIIVLVACWATTRFVASKQISGKNTGNFEVVETYAIAKDRFLQVVRIGKKYYAMAVGKENINMICEIPEEDLVLAGKANGTSVKGFSNVLGAFIKKRNNKDFSDGNDKTEE